MESTIVSKKSIFNSLNADSVTPIFNITNLFNPATDYIEVHIESNNSLLASHYDYSKYSLSKDVGTDDNRFPSVDVNPINDLKYYGYVSGDYKIYYNFLRKIFSTDLSKYFFVKEISPSRKEVRISSNTLSNEDISSNFSRLQSNILATSYVYNLLLNCGSNVFAQVINVALDTADNNYSILLKLDDPLPSNVNLSHICWLNESISLSTVYDVNLVNIIEVDETSKIKGPNFNIEVVTSNSYTTKYLGSAELEYIKPTSTSGDPVVNNLTDQNNLNKLLYLTKNKNISINVDYSDFKQFVHFSSVEDRIKNFIDKVIQIEDIEAQVAILINLNSNITQIGIDIQNLNEQKSSIISKFDGYEHHLYFEHGDTSYPKVDDTKPYVLQPSSTVVSSLWYFNIIEQAKQFDLYNDDYVWKSMPMYITENVENDNLKLYINALGHYYDNIWIYIKSLDTVYENKNNLNKGISKDLVSDMLKSFGLKLYNSSEEFSLYDESVGTNSDVLSLDNLDVISPSDYNKELHKRLYHNLPLLLKSKGSSKSIRTLLSIYGIPDEVIQVDTKLSGFVSDVASENYINTHSLKIGVNSGYFISSWFTGVSPITPKTIQFRVLGNTNSNTILESGGLSVTVEQSTDILLLYKLHINSSTISVFSENNDKWSTISITYDPIEAEVKLSVYNNNVDSANTMSLPESDWDALQTNDIIIGESIIGEFYISSFRLYTNPLSIDLIKLQAENPNSLLGINASDLLISVPLGFDNIIPSTWVTNTAYTGTLTINKLIPIDSDKVTYFPFTGLTIGANTTVYNRYTVANVVKAAFIVTNRSNYADAEKDGNSSFYKSALTKIITKNYDYIKTYSSVEDDLLTANTKQIDYKSKTTLVDASISRSKDLNKDITNYLQQYDINSHFGDPKDLYSDSYRTINELRNTYFDNNTFKYDYIDYIFLSKYINTSLFKMIQDFVPMGTNVITGVSVQPAITDRSKVQYKRNIENQKYGDDGIIKIAVIESDYSDNYDVNLDLIDYLDEVGDNKYIKGRPTKEDDFIRSDYNTLYGNVHLNATTNINNSNTPESSCKLYRLTNNGSTAAFVNLVLCSDGSPFTTKIYAGTHQLVCVRSEPQTLSNDISVEILNHYGCEFDAAPLTISTTPVEFQGYYSDLSSFNLPRYFGSKVSSKTINNWTEGDTSYGKTAAVDSHVNQVALFTRIQSGSIGYNFNNVTIKYLVDKNGNFTELNELNKNLFDVQNIFKDNENLTISLFDSLQYGNQKSTNGIKDIYNSGYFYNPILYYSNLDAFIKFDKFNDNILGRFSANASSGFVKTNLTDQPIVYKPTLVDNKYFIYNIFDKVEYNSYNTYAVGNSTTRVFPAYTVPDANVGYSFKSVVGIQVYFESLNSVGVTYNIDVVKSTNGVQSLNDAVLSTQSINILPGVTTRPDTKLTNSRIPGSWTSSFKITIDSITYDDVNNILIPKGTYDLLQVPSEEVNLPGTPDYDAYQDRYTFMYIVYLGKFYMTGIRQNNVLPFGTAKNLLIPSPYVTRTLNLTTPLFSNLNVNDMVYFRLYKSDVNPSIAEVITTGLLTVDIVASDVAGVPISPIENVIDNNTILFTTQMTKYYQYQQSPEDSVLYSKYGDIESTFKPESGDIISIKHLDSKSSYIYTIQNVYIANVLGVQYLGVTVVGSLPLNVITTPERIQEFVVSRRVKDETNIVLNFKKKDGDTSYGILIPERISPDYMENIDVIIKGIKEKLINIV